MDSRRTAKELQVTRKLVPIAVSLVLIAAALLRASSASAPDVQSFFRDSIGLTQGQISAIGAGKPVTKTMPPCSPDEVFLFGAIYIHATPEDYLEFARDLNRLRKLPNYLALGVFSNPPRLSDLDGFSLDDDDIKALKNCRPGDCLIQIPTSSIETIHQSINWSAADVDNQVNQLARSGVLELLLAYQREGNRALGVYNDKRDPTDVADHFAFMLSYNKALPEYLPAFNNYLLSYPAGRPQNVEDTFYWAKVKFGLKPTLRVVHAITMRGSAAGEPACVVAEKQLYSSHYFETALDLSFCIRDGNDSSQPGFYLIMALASEQSGLTGIRGTIVRKVAVDRSVSSLQDALTTIRATLESKQ
ncbi:MAG TPA: hypothetical protein VN774_05880 [Candidatus Limnocylindrales bacterium]|nr:hypothetical protein [Candidatus Limnocylindrales bacterium]